MARLPATAVLLLVLWECGSATQLRAPTVGVVKGAHSASEDPIDALDKRLDDIVDPTIVRNEKVLGSHREDWGEPFYDEALPTWDELQAEAGAYGHTCDPMHPIKACGLKYVCRNKMCQSCQLDRECPSRYECNAENQCSPRGLSWKWNDLLLSVLVFLVAACSAAAGVGGGSVYVPMFLLLVGVHTHDAVPISQAMIFMTSIVNLAVFVFQRHHLHPTKSKIDYDIAMLFQPNLSTGVLAGILLHRISPAWLITACLIVTLVIGFERTVSKGIKSWREETVENAARGQIVDSDSGASRGVGKLLKDFWQMQCENKMASLVIWLVWLSVFFFNYLHPTSCTGAFWGVAITLVVGMALLTAVITWHLKSRKNAGDNDWSLEGSRVWSYPVAAFVAGFLGGFLGIGGGIIMSPVLLEIGLHSSAVQATSALIVFLSSSTASLQFYLLDKILWMHVVYFGGVAVLGTIFGQTALGYVVSHYRRPSLVVFSLALILALSAVLMAVLGVVDAVNDYGNGQHMGFRTAAICGE